MVEGEVKEGRTNLFHRYQDNPILKPAEWPYPVNAVFNPGVTVYKDETLLLVRVEDMRGFSHLTAARSKDGRTNWSIDSKPTLEPDKNVREEIWGIEDPRIVWLEELGKYAITYVSHSMGGPQVSLMLTEDFKTFERLGPLLPLEDKDASLFPRCIGGLFMLIHRPIIRGEAHIWLSCSPDLKHWGDHRILIPVRSGWWDAHRVGLGPPPVETPEGWLVIYHGARVTASGSTYRLGWALLDLDKPWEIKCRSQEWIFGPRESYERIGDVPGVTFASGVVVDKQTNEYRLYYGAADSTVALATADMDKLMAYVLSCKRE